MNSDDPVAPYEPLVYHGSSIKIDTKGKTVVVPTGNPTLLPLFNEYVENADRLTTAESPFGGMKGSYPPDYAVGTVYTPTEGIYLTDTSGTNSTKTLTAGKLKELGLLSVDTSEHKITEEFIIRNDSAGSDVTVIDPLTSGWAEGYATGGTITYANGVITNTDSVCDASGRSVLMKSIGLGFLLGKAFIKFTIVSNTDASLYCLIVNPDASTYKLWAGVRFSLTGNVPTTFVLPISAPVASTGANPSSLYEQGGTFDMNNISRLYIGVAVSAGATVSYSVTDVKSCNGTWAQVEVAVPDQLNQEPYSVLVYSNEITTPTVRYKLTDEAYTMVGSDSSRLVAVDGTTYNDMYGVWTGRGFYIMGSCGETKNRGQGNGAPNTFTYSSSYGALKRIGFAFLVPPSDGNRTGINQVKLKLEIFYDDENGNTVKDLSGNSNHGTIVGGVTKLNEGGLKFDGSSGYIHFGNPLHLQLVQYNDFAVAFRYKHVVGGKKGNLFDHYYFKATPYSSTLQATFMAYNGTAWFNLYSIVDIYDGNEHFIIYNKSGNTINLYVDGVLRDSQTSDSPFVNGSLTKYLVFGRYNEAASVYTNGSLLSFSVLTRNPTALEIAGEINPADTILTVCPTPLNMGSTTHDFADSTNASYGLHHMVKPWIALLEDDTQEIDFYLFDERPKNLKYKQDESGKIYELEVFPGNGNCYHGRIKYSGLTRDTNSDGVPDCLDPDVEGSITKFLKTLDFFH